MGVEFYQQTNFERKMIVWTFALSFNPLQLIVLQVFSFPTLWNCFKVTICNCNLQVCYCTCNLSWISLVLQLNKRTGLSHNHPSVRSTHQPKKHVDGQMPCFVHIWIDINNLDSLNKVTEIHTYEKHVDRSHLLLYCPSEVPFACQA